MVGGAAEPQGGEAQHSRGPQGAPASGRAQGHCGGRHKGHRLQCQDAVGQITLPFSLWRHICSYCLLLTRVVVMKSLYLHKVIVHVIKKKKKLY